MKYYVKKNNLFVCKHIVSNLYHYEQQKDNAMLLDLKDARKIAKSFKTGEIKIINQKGKEMK